MGNANVDWAQEYFMPRDITRQETRRIAAQMEELKSIVVEAVQHTPIWGFKDPRTSNLLPLWDIILREAGIRPKYVFCLRDPGAVVSSMKTHFSREENLAELLWLSRVSECIVNGGREMFLVHYEDWFAPADAMVDLATRLLRFAGLPTANVAGTAPDIVRAGLNRSVSSRRPVNPYADRLYQALRALPSGPLDTEPLLALAKEAKHVTGFYTSTVLQFSAAATASDAAKRTEEARRQATAELKSAQQQAADLQATVALMGKELQERTAAAESMQAAMARMEKELQERTETVEGLRAARGRTEKELQERTETVEGLRAALGRMEKELQERSTLVEEGQAAIGRMERELQERSTLVEEGQAAIGRMEKELQERTATVENMQGAIAQAGAANSRLEAMVSELQTQSGTARQQVAELEAARAELQARVADLTTQAAQRTAELDAQVRRVEEAMSARDALQRQLEEARSAHQALAADMAAMVEEHRKFVLRFKLLAEESERLRMHGKGHVEPTARRERAPETAKAPAALPAVVVAKEVRSPQSPARRKLRKLVRSPGLFFSDMYAKIRA